MHIILELKTPNTNCKKIGYYEPLHNMEEETYRVNLIAPMEMSDREIGEFRSNLREVMLYIKYSKDKKKLDKIRERDSKFQSMERQAAEVINVVTGSKLKYPEGKGVVNMCLAIQQMREESFGIKKIFLF